MTPVTEMSDAQLLKELDAARWFSAEASSMEVMKAADERISECEREFDRRRAEGKTGDTK